MAGLPAFQFYPGDWLRDGVSACSLAAQGFWLRMLIVGHDSEKYGVLVINGKPMTQEMIARKCGVTVAEVESLLAELDSAGVPSRTPDGAIYSRRMVRDGERKEAISKERSEAGKAGNQKRWAKKQPQNKGLSQTNRKPVANGSQPP